MDPKFLLMRFHSMANSLFILTRFIFLRENKIRKKTLSVTPYLEKMVYEKPNRGSRVKLLIRKVW